MASTSPTDNVTDLRAQARAALARADAGSAIALLSRAAKLEPDNNDALTELGLAYRQAQRYDAARYVLERAVLQGAGRNPSARLILAQVLELDERPELALLHYCRSLMEAQRIPAWRESASAELRALSEHAQRLTVDGRNAWFARVLDPLRAKAPSHAFARIDGALAIYLHAAPLRLADPQQVAGFMYVPDLPASRFPAMERFDFLVRAGAAIAPLRDEVDACLAAGPASQGTRTLAVMSRGNTHGEARRCAPRLLAALAALPLARVRNHGPDCEILALDAGAALPPMQGRTNSRCRILVNLADSALLRVQVGNEACELAPAQGLALDPSFRYQIGNSGAAPARALIFDVWHPDLSVLEQQALSALFVAAVDFDTRLMELP
jgi:aspartate beta-hydroxylase